MKDTEIKWTERTINWCTDSGKASHGCALNYVDRMLQPHLEREAKKDDPPARTSMKPTPGHHGQGPTNNQTTS